MAAIHQILKEIPALITTLQGSPLVLFTLLALAAFAIIGLALLLLGKKL